MMRKNVNVCYNGLMKKLIVKSAMESRQEIDQRLVSIGMDLSPVIWQHERVYVPHDYRPNMNFPRLVMRTEVRTPEQPASYAMFLKRHIEDSGVDMVNFTPVGDYTEATAIIHQLGFRKVAEVSRRRQEAWLDKQTVIYIDEIEGFNGAFLKIEAELNAGEAVETLRKDLFTILSMLGLKTFMMQAYFDVLQNGVQPYWLPE